jgi:hypothetical protein
MKNRIAQRQYDHAASCASDTAVCCECSWFGREGGWYAMPLTGTAVALSMETVFPKGSWVASAQEE